MPIIRGKFWGNPLTYVEAFNTASCDIWYIYSVDRKIEKEKHRKMAKDNIILGRLKNDLEHKLGERGRDVTRVALGYQTGRIKHDLALVKKSSGRVATSVLVSLEPAKSLSKLEDTRNRIVRLLNFCDGVYLITSGTCGDHAKNILSGCVNTGRTLELLNYNISLFRNSGTKVNDLDDYHLRMPPVNVVY